MKNSLNISKFIRAIGKSANMSVMTEEFIMLIMAETT
jgi:hypothetical protein